MKITPTGSFVLVRMRDIFTGKTISLPEGKMVAPYGEVVAHGPDCKTTKVGQFVLFVPEAYIAGFDQGKDERFIISEGSIFALINPDVEQDETTETKNSKNPPKAA